ncbi:MAG: trypsin-like peptidase domain-containing protein [Planctomycetota bacterium]
MPTPWSENSTMDGAIPPENPVLADGAPAPRTFDKPNLVLKDPDPYAFANRIRRLTLVFAALCLLVAGPFLVGRFVYQFRYAQLQAEVDVATEGLAEIKPRLQDLMTASRLVAKRIGPSVVSVQRPDFKGAEGQGSGVIVDEQGYVLTNYHVVADAVGLYVVLDDGRTTDATVVGVDPGADLALLKIDEANLIAAEWGDSDDLQVGDLVWAAGSPFGLQRSVTFGIVSATERRSSSGVTGTAYQEYLQTDVAVNPGNSGGPLVDIEGKVVGINTAIVGPSYRGISFAIPTSIARRQYELLKEDGWIKRGYLGVSPTDVPTNVRRRMKLDSDEGVFVSKIVEPGPASNAGMQQGDVIIRWNGYRAGDATLLSREIASTEVGSTANVVVKRLVRGQPRELTMPVRVGVSPFSIRPGGR